MSLGLGVGQAVRDLRGELVFKALGVSADKRGDPRTD